MDARYRPKGQSVCRRPPLATRTQPAAGCSAATWTSSRRPPAAHHRSCSGRDDRGQVGVGEPQMLAHEGAGDQTVGGLAPQPRLPHRQQVRGGGRGVELQRLTGWAGWTSGWEWFGCEFRGRPRPRIRRRTTAARAGRRRRVIGCDSETSGTSTWHGIGIGPACATDMPRVFVVSHATSRKRPKTPGSNSDPPCARAVGSPADPIDSSVLPGKSTTSPAFVRPVDLDELQTRVLAVLSPVGSVLSLLRDS